MANNLVYNEATGEFEDRPEAASTNTGPLETTINTHTEEQVESPVNGQHLVFNELTGDFEKKNHPHPPVISKFVKKEPHAIINGQPYTLSWIVEEADKLLLDGTDIGTAGTGVFEKIATTAGNAHHTLTAINDCGEVSSGIDITIEPTPTIELSASSVKTRRGKEEEVTVDWKVASATANYLCIGNNTERIPAIGSRTITPNETTKIRIRTTVKDNPSVFEEELTIEVLPEADVNFSSSLEYTLKGVPVELKWDVNNALKVELVNYGEEPHEGSIVEEIGQDTVFILKVTDNFGVAEFKKEIKILPLPHVKALMVPTPDLSQNLSVSITQPSFNVGLHLPEIEPLSTCSMPLSIKSVLNSSQFPELTPKEIELDKSLFPIPETKNLITLIKQLIKKAI